MIESIHKEKNTPTLTLILIHWDRKLIINFAVTLHHCPRAVPHLDSLLCLLVGWLQLQYSLEVPESIIQLVCLLAEGGTAQHCLGVARVQLNGLATVPDGLLLLVLSGKDEWIDYRDVYGVGDKEPWVAGWKSSLHIQCIIYSFVILQGLLHITAGHTHPQQGSNKRNSFEKVRWVVRYIEIDLVSISE